MAAVPQDRPLTLEDYLALPDHNDSEIVRGVLFDVPLPGLAHQDVVKVLAEALDRYVRRGGGHRLQVIQGADLLMDARNTYVSPDLMYFPPEAVPALLEIWARNGRIHVERARPDLVVEVLSPDSASRDLVEKLGEYAAVGIPHYWVLDPRERTFDEFVLRVAERGEGQYGRVSPASGHPPRSRVRPRLSPPPRPRSRSTCDGCGRSLTLRA